MRVLCTRTDANGEYTKQPYAGGIHWARTEDGMVSEEMPDEKAQPLLQLEGYERFEGDATKIDEQITAYKGSRESVAHAAATNSGELEHAGRMNETLRRNLREARGKIEEQAQEIATLRKQLAASGGSPLREQPVDDGEGSELDPLGLGTRDPGTTGHHTSAEGHAGTSGPGVGAKDTGEDLSQAGRADDSATTRAQPVSSDGIPHEQTAGDGERTEAVGTPTNPLDVSTAGAGDKNSLPGFTGTVGSGPDLDDASAAGTEQAAGGSGEGRAGGKTRTGKAGPK